MRKPVILLAVPLVLLLAGCSGISGYLDEAIKRESGIYEDPSYQQYQSYYESGSLDQDGYMQDVSEQAPEEDTKPAARITFSQNGYLDVRYYLDAEQTNELTASSCRLKLGESIYAVVKIGRNVPSTAYEFSGFRLNEYDESGQVVTLSSVPPSEDGLVFHVTEEQIGKEYSLAPLGEYKPVTLNLKDCYLDENEEEHDLNGQWIINNLETIESNAEISPVSSCIISYKFDSDKFFYCDSDPVCFYSNNDDGVVIFNKREATDETLNYSVTLHQYKTISVRSEVHRYVTVNKGEKQEIQAGEELKIQQLKYGDTVTIETDTEWSYLENCREFILLSSEPPRQSGQTMYCYTLGVPQKDGEFIFDPSEYSYEHGKIIFKCFAEEVTTKQVLAKGSKIYYEQASADEDYWLPDGNLFVTVTTEEETRQQLNAIHFVKKVKVNVQLKQPPFGGKIEYYAGGSRIYSSTYQADSGTEITMKFIPWEGWINNFKNGEKYKITDAPSQSVTISGKDVSSANIVFEEDETHKPTLEIILDKSVGESMEFSFEASGLTKADYHYENGWFRNDYKIIDPKNQTIGTERGIEISMGNRAIQSGTAVKIQIEKTGEDRSSNGAEKKEFNDYRLVDNLTELQKPIDIYSNAEMGTSPIWWKSIKITISVVDVLKYTQPSALAHATLTVRNSTDLTTIKNGDLFEKSEKVTVTISPNNGYYVSGKNVKNDIYQDTMKFEKFMSDMNKIINDHPVEKYCQVTLDASDPYGTCTFKRDGNIVSGTIYVKPKEKITLEYKITDSAYLIEGASGFFGTPLGKNEKEKSATITIDTTHDGKTLTRESFGIGVVKGA